MTGVNVGGRGGARVGRGGGKWVEEGWDMQNYIEKIICIL
jgi:hypothetical protein